jgi:hypothetical protein
MSFLLLLARLHTHNFENLVCGPYSPPQGEKANNLGQFVRSGLNPFKFVLSPLPPKSSFLNAPTPAHTNQQMHTRAPALDHPYCEIPGGLPC